MGEIQRKMFSSLRVSVAMYFLLVTNPCVDGEKECGLWLGPSPTKASTEQGFGFGVFTGQPIYKGSLMQAEPIVPLYDLDFSNHPPLREYLGIPHHPHDNSLVLESLDNMLIFVPGIAAIAPCSDDKFNLKRNTKVFFNNWNAHRSVDPESGASSYETVAMYSAARDIQPGEELVIECSADDFDAGVLFTSHPELADAQNTRICLDDTLEERESSAIHGRGSFARRDVPKDTVLVSTPMAPIHRDQLDMKVRGKDEQQLLLNYCYGHPESVLLWLPHGPTANAINHSPNPNARIRWHVPSSSSLDGGLSPRQQFHHPELLDTAAEQVAQTHGKAMVMDVVSTRFIEIGEEVVIDYGDDWVAAWEEHQNRWPMGKEVDIPYISAEEYNLRHGTETVRTIMEQNRNAYPSNMLTACYFETDWAEDMEMDDQEDKSTFESWNNQKNHRTCLMPCDILKREKHHDDGEGSTTLYMAKLTDTHGDNMSIEYNCHLESKFEYIYSDIPREGIIFINVPYSSDVWLPHAFRQPIGLPDTMVPSTWKSQNVRRRPSNKDDSQEKYKRKVVTKKHELWEERRMKGNQTANVEVQVEDEGCTSWLCGLFF